MQVHRPAAIGEGAAVAGVEIALRRQPLGQQHVVRRQFDVPVGDAPDIQCAMEAPLMQVAHRDQHAVHEHRMVGRQQQRAQRLAGTEGIGRDAHRLHVPRPRMAPAIHAAVPEPDDRRRAAAGRAARTSPTRERFHRHLAARGGDAGAGGEAGRLDERTAAAVRTT